MARQRLSLDRNWRFALGHAADASKDFEFVRSRCLVKAGEARGAAGRSFDDSSWRLVNVPHDWAIELPLDPKGDKELAEHGFRAIGPDHPESSIGWYRRTFKIPKTDLGRRISIEFDGVFRDSIVWVNGHRLGRHESGYTGFRFDITDVVDYGGVNVVVVRANASSWEGWWYEGAGIYRHVWLVKTDPLHVAPCGAVVTTKLRQRTAHVTVRTTIANESERQIAATVTHEVRDPDGKMVARTGPHATKVAPWSNTDVSQELRLKNPKLWSCHEPNLYSVHTTLRSGSRVTDAVDTVFGIRTLKWDAKRGFFLNGKYLKIKGTCNHQHHAGVGIALPDRLQNLRIEKLKELGSNAYRCSHYAATPELLDACDRLGMLVVAENRRAGSSPAALAEFESMIRRDRNHPCIVLWSLANEEHTVQWSPIGERIGRSMVRLAHQLDPTRKVTAAMHDRGLGAGFANIVDVHGWNYIKVGDIEDFHRRRPAQLIVGSEEGSTVCTRGIYADDASRGYVSAYDVRTPKWGSTAEGWWSFFAERPWLAGGFVWTGFDYYGEPIPYKWPCTSSHFGLMDLCGFPKDNYFYYQAWWSDRPVLHLLPHWTWPDREGDEIDVRCFSNCEQVELLLNGQNLGRQKMPRNSHLAWKVRYRPGRLEARGFRGGQLTATTAHETAGPPARIVLAADRTIINADGEDVSAITVSVVDRAGRLAPTASNRIELTVSGAGKLLGVGNGDPSSHESDKAPQRNLFNGLCLALVQSPPSAGAVRITATSPRLIKATITLQARRCALRPQVLEAHLDRRSR